jgi:homospermidine synthase
VIDQYSNWTPLSGRGELLPKDVDRSDPWQFKNVLAA